MPWWDHEKQLLLFSAASFSHHHDQVEKWDNGSGVKRHWVKSCVSVNSSQVFEGCSASEGEGEGEGEVERKMPRSLGFMRLAWRGDPPLLLHSVTLGYRRETRPVTVRVRRRKSLRLDPAVISQFLACKAWVIRRRGERRVQSLIYETWYYAAFHRLDGDSQIQLSGTDEVCVFLKEEEEKKKPRNEPCPVYGDFPNDTE